MTNSERRDAGMAYIADSGCAAEMMECRKLLQELNFMDRSDFDGIRAVVEKLFGGCDNPSVNPPFFCDYGKHIFVGKNFYANYNCTILDVGRVTIGDNVFFAPNVSVYTAGHPVHPVSRNSGYEYGLPVTIGSDCWIGGNTVICPGVTIGSGVVIGAGSVVTKDIPSWSVAVGNPCKVIRSITEEDKKYLYGKTEFDEKAMADILAFEGGAL